MFRKLATCGLIGLLSPGAVAAKPVVPIAAFADRDNVINPVLSPDGKHLAVTMDVRDTILTYRMVTIYSLPDMKVVSAMKSAQSSRPSQYLWVSNRRLVLSNAFRYADGIDVATGEIQAFDLDGGRQQYLFGRRRLVDGKPERDECWPSAFAVLPARDDTLLITASGPRCNSTLLRVNTVDGSRTRLAELPEKYLNFLTDEEGRPQIAYRTDVGNKLFIRRFDAHAQTWLAGPGDGAVHQLMPLKLTSDGLGMYALRSGQEPTALVMQPLDGRPQQVLASYPDRDVDTVQWAMNAAAPFAAGSKLGLPSLRYLDDTLAESQIQKTLTEQFPGQIVRLMQGSRDASRWLFRVSSDRDPGSLYLYDSAERKASLLVTVLEKIDPDTMAPMRPIRYTARDGSQLHGYLTLPLNAGPEHKPPLIVLPHGGPHDVADAWGFDRDVQFLASRGYAVLQVNFRGSGGRGQAFVQAGYRNWGGTVMDDILDGVAWVAGQQLVDTTRICTVGTSFGAYAAMMLTIRSPGTFRCAVGNAGLYDIALHMQSNAKEKELIEVLHQYLGVEPAEWDRISPAKLADKIKVPVMLAHGREDDRTALNQARAMRAALKASGNAPNYFEASTDGHGFQMPSNIEEFYEKLERFLAEQLR